MESDGMMSIGDALASAFRQMSADGHVEASDGDFVAEDGYLCCGKCGQHKEFRRFIPFMQSELVVPCLCRCGIAARERMEAEDKVRRERAIVGELLSYSLIDEEFKSATFERFIATDENARALRIAQNYVKNFDLMFSRNQGLLMYGTTGTGKSFLASCIANELMRRNVPILATSIINLTRDSDALNAVLHKMNAARLLILDDFGAERDTPFMSEQVFSIIDSRINSKRPMIITTNLTLDSLKNEQDIRRKRISDRILKDCHPVKMVWESWRRKLLMEKYDDTVSLLEAE